MLKRLHGLRWYTLALLPLFLPDIGYFPGGSMRYPVGAPPAGVLMQAQTGSSALSGFFTSFWKLADTSDSIGSLTMTQSATPVTFSAGKIGNAGNFDTTPRFLLNSTAVVAGGSFTVACWAKTSSAVVNQWVFSYWDNTSGSVQLYLNTAAVGKVSFRTEIAKVLSSTASTYNDGQWHLIVAYHDGATGINTLVVDNGSPDTLAATADVAAGTHPMSIGRYSAASINFTGMVDACGIADGKTPSAAQLTAMWNAGVGAEPPF